MSWMGRKAAGFVLLFFLGLGGLPAVVLGRADTIFSRWHRTLAQASGTCEEYFVRSYVGHPDEDTCNRLCSKATKAACLAYAFDAPTEVCFLKVPCGSTGPDELKFPTPEEMLAPVEAEEDQLSAPAEQSPPSALDDAWADFWAKFGAASAPGAATPEPPLVPEAPIASDIRLKPEGVADSNQTPATTAAPANATSFPSEIVDSAVAFEIVNDGVKAEEKPATEAADAVHETPTARDNSSNEANSPSPATAQDSGAVRSGSNVTDGSDSSKDGVGFPAGDVAEIPSPTTTVPENNSLVSPGSSTVPDETSGSGPNVTASPTALPTQPQAMFPVWTDALPEVPATMAQSFSWTILDRVYCHAETKIKVLQQQTLSTCMEACGQLLSCGGWAFREEKKHCRLVHACEIFMTPDPNTEGYRIRPWAASWTSGYKEVVQAKAVPTHYQYSVSEATVCNDPNVAKASIKGSIGGCQDACSEMQLCHAYSYDGQSATCWLTATCTLASDAPGWTSGVKTSAALGGQLLQPAENIGDSDLVAQPNLVKFVPFDPTLEETQPDLSSMAPFGETAAEDSSPKLPAWGSVMDYDLACTLNSAPLSYHCHADCAVNCAAVGMNGLLVPGMLENELHLCHSTHSKSTYQGSACCCGEDLSLSAADDVVIPCPGDLQPWAACDAWCRLHATELGPDTAVDCVPDQAWCFPYGLLGGGTGNCHSIECSSFQCCCNARN